MYNELIIPNNRRIEFVLFEQQFQPIGAFLPFNKCGIIGKLVNDKLKRMGLTGVGIELLIGADVQLQPIGALGIEIRLRGGSTHSENTTENY